MWRAATRCAPISRSTRRCSRVSLQPAKFGILLDMPAVHIYQILNYFTPREALDPGFLVLDNSSNERHDWYEYWPMRMFWRGEPLDEQAYYGFLSPKFRLKTNLAAAQVREFIERAPSD